MQPFNKYYPPDWTPDKGSVNKFVGKHPLGDRARKIDQGILVVRFELPFNIWCTGCENHVGKGVRYNAEKKKIGNYYSTPILQFRMRCHLCSNWIEIHTDPKNAEYKVVSGARKKVEEWEPEDNEVIRLQDEETKERLETDPIFRLEHGIQDKRTAEDDVPILTRLQQLNDSQWSDPYTRSQELRRKFREQKKKDKELQKEADEIRDKHSLHIDLLPESPSDSIQAKMVDFAAAGPTVEERKLEKSVGPIFASSSSSSSSSSSKKRKKPSAPNAVQKLALKAALQTRKKMDPFLSQNSNTANAESVQVKPTKRTRQSSPDPAPLVAYDSD